MATHEGTSDLGDFVLHFGLVLTYYPSGTIRTGLFHYRKRSSHDEVERPGAGESRCFWARCCDAGRTDEAVEHYGQALVLAEANGLECIGER